MCKINPYDPDVLEIMVHLENVHKLALEIGIKNIHEPGLVRDIKAALVLGHLVRYKKHGPSSTDLFDENVAYQYYHSKSDGTCQIHDYTQNKSDSLKNIEKIYFVFYDVNTLLDITCIFEFESSKVVEIADNKLNNSTNEKVHIGTFSLDFCKEEGKLVYKNHIMQKNKE